MWTDLVCRLRALFARTRVERELDEELRFHFDRQVEVYRHAGVDELEARRRARLDVGGLDQVKEEYRDSLGVRLIDDLRRDMSLAVRALRATPLVSAVAILSLGLVVGANTAIFSILNGLLLRTLPVRAPDRLVHVTDSVPRETGETRVRAWSYPAWDQIRQRPYLLEAATAWSFTRFNLASGGETQFVEGIWADGNFFGMLGVPAVVGRTFSTLDDRPGGGLDGPVTVMSYRYWHTRLGGATDVVGRSIRLNGVPFTIVGVTPPEFFGVEVGRSFDFIVPLQTEALIRGRDSALDSASTNFLSILARLKPGQSLDVAAAELRRVQPEIRKATLGPWSQDVADRYLTSPFTVVPAATGYSNLRSNYQRPLLILIAIVGLVLLIGCVNIANLSLARATSRRRELSMRLALGASRARLTRQMLAESLTLAAAGAGLGLVIAAYGGAFLVTQLSTPTNPVVLDVSIDGPVLGFAVVITVLTALMFGTAPAFRAARVEPMDALKSEGRASEEGRAGLMAWLVVAQVTFSVVLVVAAGLFIRSFVSLANRDLGLNADPVLVVTVDSQGTTLDASNRVSLYERTRAAVLGLPNVAEAAISLQTPASSGGFTPAVEIVDAAVASPSRRLVPANADVFGNLVSAGWFRTFGTPITAGRDFTDEDRRGAPRVAVVNETFARRFFGNRSPLGHTIVVYPNTPQAMPAQIVGVAGDAIYGSPREAVPPTWYVPMAQFDRSGMAFASARLSVRAHAGPSELLTKSVAASVAEVDPQLALTFRPLATQIHAALTRERLMAQLAGALGVLALILAGLGLYGVTAYAISRQRTEIAVRIAMGALPGRVITLVLARVWLLVGLGIAAGTGISLWASRFVSGLIHGLSPHDPEALVGAAVLLCAMGTAAAWLPARRAARMDPVAVLREN
jgi:putative ABC transport system permease protein